MTAHHEKAGRRRVHARPLAINSIANPAAAEGPVVITEQGEPLMAVPPGGAHERPPETPGHILEALSTEGTCEIEIDFPRPTTPPQAATFE